MPYKDVRPFRDKLSNEEILNAVRHDASSDYQARVPAATKGKIQKTVDAMMDSPTTRNEFIEQFINKIGLTIHKNRMWTNPLAMFKIGMLAYGDTIEEYHTGLTKAYVYDHDRDSLEKTIWGKEPNEAQVSYHRINRENFYKLTINEMQLRRAFQSPTGLYQLINELMAVPIKSDNLDEFLLMASLFAEAERMGGIYKIHVDDVGAAGSDSVQAKFAIRRVRELVATLPFISRDYNAAHMPSHAEEDDLILVMTPEAAAAMDVEALAAAFNVDKLSLPDRRVILPAKYIGIEGFQMAITTKDFFVVADTFLETRSIQNPADVHTNFFLHHHQIISFSRYVPFIMFWTGEGTEVNEIETPVVDVEDLTIVDRNGDTVTDVERGGLYYVDGAGVTSPAGGWNDAVKVSLSGNTSVFTRITQTKMLHVGENEEADTLTITAVSTDDNSLSETLTVSVTGEKFAIWPVPEFSADGDISVKPKKPGQTGNTIHIPTIDGIVYKNGATTVTDDVTITANTTITATAAPGYEIPAGTAANWTFNYTA